MTKKSSLQKNLIETFIRGARDAALVGSEVSLKYFEKVPPVEKKADRSPVTRADKETEQAIRKVLRAKFPTHQIVGEEFGSDGPAGSEFKWWIDPIDGTLQFIRGIPFWGSIVGLEYQNEVVAGSLLMPAVGLEIWAGKNLGSYVNGERAKVSKIASLKNATISTGSLMRANVAERKRVLNMASKAYDARGSLDIFSHAMVISGKIDAAVDFTIKPYDVSAVKICVEEAGGIYTGLSGEKTIYESSGISSNGRIHRECLKYAGS